MPYIYVGSAPLIYIPFAELGDSGFYLNVLMTFPFGIFVALLRRRNIKVGKFIGAALGVGLFIETTQLILDNLQLTDRWVDVNDVLANAAGILLGYLLIYLLRLVFIKKLQNGGKNE